MSERVEEVVLEEARQALKFQVASLDELRSRTGLLLAASSVAGSFLGSAAAKSSAGLEFVGGLAILAFATAVGACIYILLPRMDRWEFVASPAGLAGDWIDIERGDAFEMQRKLAERLEKAFDKNKERLDSLFLWFQVAAFSVLAEVILGSVNLAMNH